jgi:hypothetical protein
VLVAVDFLLGLSSLLSLLGIPHGQCLRLGARGVHCTELVRVHVSAQEGY